MSYLEIYAAYMNNQCKNSGHRAYSGWCSDDLIIDNVRKYCVKSGEYGEALCSRCRTCLLLLPIIKAQNDEIQSLKADIDSIKSHLGL